MHVQLANNVVSFNAGDTIMGTVHTHVKDEYLARRLVLRFSGIENVNWSTAKTKK